MHSAFVMFYRHYLKMCCNNSSKNWTSVEFRHVMTCGTCVRATARQCWGQFLFCDCWSGERLQVITWLEACWIWIWGSILSKLLRVESLKISYSSLAWVLTQFAFGTSVSTTAVLVMCYVIVVENKALTWLKIILSTNLDNQSDFSWLSDDLIYSQQVISIRVNE